jgi:hypothetical protein
MAITRLKRKGRKNKLKAKIRAQKFKVEGFAPVLKNVDVEAIKEEFKLALKKSSTITSKTGTAAAKVETKAIVASEVKAEKKVATDKKEKTTKTAKTAKAKVAVDKEKKPAPAKTKKKTTTAKKKAAPKAEKAK